MIHVVSGDDCYHALDNDGLIIFYFTASWCGPCQRIWEDFQKLTDSYPNIHFFKIDISDDDNNEICEKCNVESVPSFLLFNNRTYIDRVTGANLENVEKMLTTYENMLNSPDNN